MTLEGKRSVIPFDSPLFPSIFRTLDFPVERLFLIGDPSVLTEGLAIIGARKATPYGLACAHHFSSRAAIKGIIIISGGALGCDSEAHKAALEQKGKTVVFLGGGCDQIYPKQNKELFQRIVDMGGAVVSEYEWDQPPMKHGFLARNRLIAGLAKATLIVEAGLPSGTFSTADEALAANREVLVVPGSIASKTSRGANRLLYQGALPVVDDESFDDILFSLFGTFKQHAEGQSVGKPNLEGMKKIVFESLCSQCMYIDELLPLMRSKGKEKEARNRVMRLIVELESEGLIARYPDGRYGISQLKHSQGFS